MPRKKIPYALTNFKSIRTENYLYVDKTRFIEMIEKEVTKYNFLSLLFYMGLVTIDNSNPLNIGFKIPNYSIKTMYWEFIESMLTEELKGLSLDGNRYTNPIYKLAYENNFKKK